MSLLFVLEGPDGAGKSTLAENLTFVLHANRVSDVKTIHFGPPKFDQTLADSGVSAGAQAVREMMERPEVKRFNSRNDADVLVPTKALIIDRFHMGGPVYGPIYRPDRATDPMFGELTPEQYYTIDGWVRKHGGRTFVVMPPSVRLIQERLQTRGDDYVDPDNTEKLKRILWAYSTIASQTPSAEILPAATSPAQAEILAQYMFSATIMRRIQAMASTVRWTGIPSSEDENEEF